MWTHYARETPQTGSAKVNAEHAEQLQLIFIIPAQTSALTGQIS
jgi:hypothetical protein